jgi:alkanesulfonate monooxygenase SsuD/methylene tetrahydromethanopterin reductase-like flavin-dependent oxidoreductase (luciferase family)
MADIALMLEGQEDLTWERWFRFADAAEEFGFEGLFRSDHLTGLNGDSHREALALWPSLTTLAQRTDRIRFGPLVCSITFRHPAMVAKMAASVDVLSGGRLDLGLGAGWHAGEHRMFAIPYPKYSERLQRLDEGASVITALWSGQPATTQGHYPLLEAENHPQPTHPEPTLIMGGKGERTLQIVARHASEWNSSYSPLQLFIDKSAELDGVCETIGRDPGTLRRSMMLPFAIGRDSAAVQKHIDAHRVTFTDLPATADEWAENGFIVGSPDQVVDQLGTRVGAGATRFMLQQNALDDLDSVELLAGLLSQLESL